MSRDNVLQITVTESERAFVEAQAKAEGSSASGWLRRKLFFDPSGIMVRAIPCASLEEAYELVKGFDENSEKWPWTLIFRRIAESTSSSIFEVLRSDFMPWGGTITPNTRFILAGGPWPYKVLENFSWTAHPSGICTTMLRVENEQEHNLWAKPPGKPLTSSLEA